MDNTFCYHVQCTCPVAALILRRDWLKCWDVLELFCPKCRLLGSINPLIEFVRLYHSNVCVKL